MGLFDFFTSGDSAGDYLGRLVDPATVDQYKAARAQMALTGLGQGLLALGPSRLPVPFGQSLGKGVEGMLAAQKDLSGETLQAAQTGSQIAEQGKTKAETAKIQQQQKFLAGLIDLFNSGGGDAGTTGTTAAPGGAAPPVDLTKGPLPTTAGAPTPEMASLIQKAAADYKVPVDVLTGLLKVESGFKPTVVSPAGAQGLAQLMPGTARELGVTDPNDITQAIPAAARYLRQGLDAHNQDMTKALMYYHGGPNQNVWGPKTQAYPGVVLGAAKRFGDAPATSSAAVTPSVNPGDYPPGALEFWAYNRANPNATVSWADWQKNMPSAGSTPPVQPPVSAGGDTPAPSPATPTVAPPAAGPVVAQAASGAYDPSAPRNYAPPSQGLRIGGREITPELAAKMSVYAAAAGVTLPAFIAAIAGLPIEQQKAWFEVGPKLYIERNKPQTFKPGETYLPAPGQPPVMIPESAPAFDPRTGTKGKQYITPPPPPGLLAPGGPVPNNGAMPPPPSYQPPPYVPGTPPGVRPPAAPPGAVAPPGALAGPAPVGPARVGPAPAAPPPSMPAQPPAAPVGPGGPPSNFIPTEMGPAATEEQQGIGKSRAAEYTAAVKEAEIARVAQPQLITLKRALQDFHTGPGAETALEVKKKLQWLFPDTMKDWNADVANGEIIFKTGNRLGMELARKADSNPSQLIAQTAIKSNPGLGSSREGGLKLAGLLEQDSIRAMDRKTFFDEWLDKKGSIVGADRAFEQAHPPEVYLSKVIPYQPKTDADFNALPTGTVYIDPSDGRPYVKPGAK